MEAALEVARGERWVPALLLTPVAVSPPEGFFRGRRSPRGAERGSWVPAGFQRDRTCGRDTLQTAMPNLRRLRDSGVQGRVCGGAGTVTSPVTASVTGDGNGGS